MEPLEALAAASATFGDVLDQVRPEQLAVATPCEEWDVRALLGHVFAGSQMAVALLDGANQEEAMSFVGQSFGDDIVDRCREAVAGQLDRFHAVSDWDAEVHHPIGDVPSSRLLEFRTTDLTLHAWDLASALGVDAALPEDLAAVVYEHLQPMVPFIGDIGIFGSGPSGSLDDDAPLTLRLLDLTGRRP